MFTRVIASEFVCQEDKEEDDNWIGISSKECYIDIVGT